MRESILQENEGESKSSVSFLSVYIYPSHSEASLLAAVVEEANLAFKLNAGLFELIETHLDDKNKEGFIQASEVPQERLFSVASVAAVILASKHEISWVFANRTEIIPLSVPLALCACRRRIHWRQRIPETPCS